VARLGRAQPFRALLRPFRLPANPDVTIALTGVGATGSVGLLGVALAVGLTAAGATGAVGSVTVESSVALSNVAATGAAGSVTPSTTVELSGVSGTGSVGTVTTGADVTAALTGVGGTGSVGSVTPSSTVPLTGVAGTGAVGTVTGGNDVTAALTGVAGTSAVGSVTPSRTVPLTGVGGTGSVGSVGVPGAPVTVALTGVGATGSVGSISAIPGGASGTGVDRNNLLPPVPNTQEITDKHTGRMDAVWLRWQREVKLRVEALPAESLARAESYTNTQITTTTAAVQTYADTAAATAAAGVVAASTEVARGDSGTKLAIDWATTKAWSATLTANCDALFYNPVAGPPLVLVLEQGGAGSNVVTWPANVRWPGGVAPTLTAAAGSIDRVTFNYTEAGGGLYLGSVELDFA
jgi:hypothetical protein